MTSVPRSSRFDDASRHFALAHDQDPKGEARRYHEHLSRWVERLEPGASEALRLAARCQHLGRYKIPRERFPMDVLGYKRWRSELARMHAAEAGAVLREVGYDEATIARVGELLVKKGLKSDPEVQTFEDAICLTFLETEAAAFAEKHDDDKLVGILGKTWAKMSPRGHAAALELAGNLPERLVRLLERALAAE